MGAKAMTKTIEAGAIMPMKTSTSTMASTEASAARDAAQRRSVLPMSAATAPPPLTRYAQLSIAVAVATLLLKTVAWALTDSVGLLSDAVESVVNLVGGIMALWMLTVASRPADLDHAFGHSKAEYFWLF